MKDLFPKIFGNAATKNRIGTSILAGTLPHAFLITGAVGSGKKLFAKSAAAALFCENRDTEGCPLPCGCCSACRRILADNHPDVRLFAPHDGKVGIGVDDAHAIRDDAFLSPTEAEGKVYIVDSAENLTVQAQNALLTVLEEPPRGVYIFLLCASTDTILTTVKSRAQLLTMEKFSREAIRNYLEDHHAPALKKLGSPEAIEAVCIAANGQIGRALALLTKSDTESEERRKSVNALLAVLKPRTSFADIRTAVLSLPQKRQDLLPVLEDTLSALRDAVLLRKSPDAPLLFFVNAQETGMLDTLSDKRLFALSDLFAGAAEAMRQNANVNAVESSLCAHIRTL